MVWQRSIWGVLAAVGTVGIVGMVGRVRRSSGAVWQRSGAVADHADSQPGRNGLAAVAMVGMMKPIALVANRVGMVGTGACL